MKFMDWALESQIGGATNFDYSKPYKSPDLVKQSRQKKPQRNPLQVEAAKFKLTSAMKQERRGGLEHQTISLANSKHFEGKKSESLLMKLKENKIDNIDFNNLDLGKKRNMMHTHKLLNHQVDDSSERRTGAKQCKWASELTTDIEFSGKKMPGISNSRSQSNINSDKPPTPKFKKEGAKNDRPIPALYRNRQNVVMGSPVANGIWNKRATSNNLRRNRGHRVQLSSKLDSSERSNEYSHVYSNRSPGPSQGRPQNGGSTFAQTAPIRSISPRPNQFKIFNDTLNKSNLSKAHSEFDSMLSNIRPSRSNSNWSMKYRSEYDSSKRPVKSILKSKTGKTSSGIDVGLQAKWSGFANSGDSFKKSSFAKARSNITDQRRFHVQMKPKNQNIRWIQNSANSKTRSRSSVRSKKVSFQEKPKVIYVENWKILNVDMSKEGKLYSRFNRGKHGKAGDESCRVF